MILVFKHVIGFVGFFITPTEGKHATARLQPRLPYVIVRRELLWDWRQRPAMLFHSLPYSAHCGIKQGLSVSWERICLRRILGEIKQQGRVMMGYTVPETRANSSSKTGSGIFWLEYWSHIMSFPCGAPCNKTTFEQPSGSRSQGGPWKGGSSFKLPASSPRGCHVWGKSSFGDLAGTQDCFHDSKAHLSCEYWQGHIHLVHA